MSAKKTKPSKNTKKDSEKSPKPAKKGAPSAEPLKKMASAKGPAKPEDKKRLKANAALEEALLEVASAKANPKKDLDAEDPSSQDEEFDPAAFFAASGGKGLLRAQVMRKERVDLNLNIRYRFLKGPLVFNSDLLNLSKGGLCLRTPEVVKPKTVVKVEIPLPHTSELFAVQAEVIWSDYTGEGKSKTRPIHTGLRFMPMSLAKQAVINQFIQQRRDEVIMAKIGLDKFTDSVPVAGLD